MNICVLNLDVFKAFSVHVSLAGVVTTVSFSLTFELKLNFDLQSQTEVQLGLLTVKLLFSAQDEIIYLRCKYVYRVNGVLLVVQSLFFPVVYCNDLLFSVLSKINSCWLL